MAPVHSNPTRPRLDRDRRPQVAHAPYNFVPLPETPVLAQPPLSLDRYHEKDDKGHTVLTGWIECDLEICSPTYIRSMLTEHQFKAHGRKKPDALTTSEQEERAPFFATEDETVEGQERPVLPGSTLRGMTRALVEIAGFGRMRWVADEPTFTFRAVAASRDDPLRDPYQNVLGRFGSNVRAGYLWKRRDAWYVRPALTPADQGWPERSPYLKVKERQIGSQDIPGYVRFNSPDYRPQLHEVRFDVETRRGIRGSYVAVTRIGPEKAGYSHRGYLVCSGNMLETGQAGQRSPRKNHALVLEADPQARPIRIRTEAIDAYRKGVTPFQTEKLDDWGGDPGCLADGKPVFYIVEKIQVVERNQVVYVDEVAYFGHSPNFRIPARLAGTGRAVTPQDFVPEAHKTTQPDLADAIFGWVEEKDGPKEQCAGRVFFGDAHLVGARDGVWLQPTPLTPHVLSGPKPTTFQHYLVQDRDRGHDPDAKSSFAHYGTPPDETGLRGHKLYWHRGANPDIEASAKERQHESQLTRIMPLKPGVRFQCRVHFENLREAELGAILWALSLPGEPGRTYRHKLGMGRPLGMGAVQLTPRLYLSERRERYDRLFAEDAWHEPGRADDTAPYIEAFEGFVRQALGLGAGHLREIPRIQALLLLLQWYEGEAEWLEKTSYMEIERGVEKINEYKERPVLPDPVGVLEIKLPRSADRPQVTTAPHPSASTAIKHGRVKKFGLGPKQAYGFIQPDDGSEDVFVHRSQLPRGVQTLKPNQPVTYHVVQGMKGPEARDVKLE